MKALIRVTGAVQGVGYRPFVAELASKYELSGEVKNCGGIVEIIALGDDDKVRAFHEDLKSKHPHGSIVLNASIQEIKYEPEGYNAFSGFHIVQSTSKDFTNAFPVFPPDIGICPDCLRELLDENDRRFRYPLISCTSCGPRYSILNSLPYDRDNITMDVYPMCPDCKAEYKKGRRRHAQTISCHHCGPQMIYKEKDNILSKDEAVLKAIEILKNGGIIGLKGIGGYQLVCSPSDAHTVERLRDIKGREKKPFAIMFSDIEDIKNYCIVSESEEEYLTSDARPIVLLDRCKEEYGSEIDRSSFISDDQKIIAENVCGNSRQIGAFLPSSGIHELLVRTLGCLIVTSGNISGNPMIVSDSEFEDKFSDKVDGILYYEREIKRPLDDSVLSIVKLYDGTEQVRFIRRARGYVPLPVFLNKPLKERYLYIAFGADLKNTFAIGYGDRIIPSQFFGDMEELSIADVQRSELSEALRIFGAFDLESDRVEIIRDLHPAYVSSKAAETFAENLKQKCNLIEIQHHHAHIGSVMAEHGLTECLGVAFDGTGYGVDKTIWGSEVLICKDGDFERAEHLKPVKIVGQDEAMKNAAVSGTCYLQNAGIDDIVLLPDGDDKLIKAALNAGINAYPNSGMGRLFDAVSAILGISNYNSYEGECAIDLQNAAEDYIRECKENAKEPTGELLNFGVSNLEWNSADLIRDIVKRKESQDVKEISYMLHNTLAKAVLDACMRIRESNGLNDVCLSGGVFANRLLLALCNRYLKENGFVVYCNSILPTNDSGISVGQIYLDSFRKE